MRTIFSKALDENKNLDERFGELMHDTFDEIYTALGKKKFLRWIDTKEISERIKKLIIASFSKEDIERLPSNAVGYYINNTMRFREGNADLDTSRHETNHFITDIGKKFPTFINEGLTEYLSREYEKINKGKTDYPYAYPENVDFAEFLHNAIGDLLLKVYLTGTSNKFQAEFSTYITEDGKEDINKLNSFYLLLQKVHSFVFSNGKIKTPQEKEKYDNLAKELAEKDYPVLRQIVGNIAINTIRKKAHDLEYYKDGKLDKDAIYDDITRLREVTTELMQKHQLFGFSIANKEKVLELEDRIIRGSLRVILQESQIDEEKIENIISECVTKWKIQRKDNRTLSVSSSIQRGPLNNCIDSFDHNTLVDNLIKGRIANKENYVVYGVFDISSFLMDVSLVTDRLDIKGKERELFIDSIIQNYLPQEVNQDLVRRVIDKHGKLYATLYQKNQDNKHNVVDSKFVKVGENAFIEKRDKSFYFLRYNEDTGELTENKIVSQYYEEQYRVKENIRSKFKEEPRRLAYLDRTDIHNTNGVVIFFDDNFTKVMLGNNECNVMQGVQGIAEGYLIDEAMKEVSEGIKSNKYVLTLKDGEEPLEGYGNNGLDSQDPRSRIINFSLFSKDLEEAISNLPLEFRKDLSNSALCSVIRNVYGILPDNISELNSIVSDPDLINGTLNEESLEKLYRITAQLNQARREHIESMSKVVCVAFRDDEAGKKYKEAKDRREKRKNKEAFDQSVHAFVSLYGKECILEPLELKTSEEHYSSIDGLKYFTGSQVEFHSAIANKVDYNAFCNYLREYIEDIPAEKRDSFIEEVVDQAILMWYGEGRGYLGKKTIDVSRSDNMFEIMSLIKNSVLDDRVPLDMEQIRSLEKTLVNLSAEEIKKCEAILQSRKPAGFEFEGAKQTYEKIQSIQKDSTLDDNQKAAMISNLKAKNSRKRKIAEFGKLATSGENIPSSSDISRASKVIDFYRENGRGD